VNSFFVHSNFGEYYQILVQGRDANRCVEMLIITDAAKLFSIVTRELTIPADQWRGVLMRLGISIPPNFFHPADIYHEVVKLCQRGVVQLVKIRRLEQLPTLHVKEGWGYCFTLGPQRHPSLSYSPVPINSVVDAQAFIQSLQADEKTVRHFLPAGIAMSSQDLAELFATRRVLVYEVPVPTASPTASAVEYVSVRAIDREVPLAPETNAAPAKCPSTIGARKGVAPTSLDDAALRLGTMKPEIQANGHIPKYTDAQLLQQAQIGEVANERYHARFMEVGHQWAENDTTKDERNLTGKLGREFSGETGTGPRYWSTTFDQIEDADTDSQLICQKLGIDYDPDKKYMMAVIDTEKAKPLTGCECVSATFGNVSEFTNRELPAEFPQEFTDQVMNPDYQADYKAHYQDARDNKFLKTNWSTDTKDFSDYLSTTDLGESEKEVMIQRMNIWEMELRKIGLPTHPINSVLSKLIISSASPLICKH
jgi:hypothetical protein